MLRCPFTWIVTVWKEPSDLPFPVNERGSGSRTIVTRNPNQIL